MSDDIRSIMEDWKMETLQALNDFRKVFEDLGAGVDCAIDRFFERVKESEKAKALQIENENLMAEAFSVGDQKSEESFLSVADSDIEKDILAAELSKVDEFFAELEREDLAWRLNNSSSSVPARDELDEMLESFMAESNLDFFSTTEELGARIGW